MYNDSILRVENLTIAFGTHRVVEGVNYELRRGKTLGIVGESGSGKSMSSLALMGILPEQATIESGAAWFDGVDLLQASEKEMQHIRGRRISMVFQEPMTSLNPVATCGRQVMEAIRQHDATMERDEMKRRVIELFGEVMLPRPEKIFASYPHQLSGGQRQRVMIAMALVCKPDILIADEPTTALDVTVQRTILDLLRQLQQRHGMGIIFVSHDLGVISQVADDVLVMYRGRVVEQGLATEILAHPRHPYTKGLLACRPPLDSRPLRLPTVEDYLKEKEQPVGSVARGEQRAIEISTTPLLSVQNLTVTYTLKKNIFGKATQRLNAVYGLTFTIGEGETLGLVGESGCGKSTLGRALLRLIESADGTVAYRGMPLNDLSEREMRELRTKLQIVFQDPYSSLNPRLSIGEAIAEPMRVHHRHGAKERAIEMMQRVGLSPDWYGRFPHQLSGGQRQRVGIARALVLEPELVVCDESVSALDVSVQAQVLNLLLDLKEQFHYTYLFISHDLSVVHYIADRVMVMQRGKIVESGSPDDIFGNPKTEYTRTLIDAIPRIE